MNEVAKTDGNYTPVSLGVTADVAQYITMLRANTAGDALLVEVTNLTSGVTSLNGLTGAVVLAAGTNITLVPVGNTITINGISTPINPNSINLANTHILVGGITNTASDVALTLSATGGSFALANTGILTMPNANATTRGLLTSTDWNTFNNHVSSPITDLQNGLQIVGTIGKLGGYLGENTAIDGDAGTYSLGLNNLSTFTVTSDGLQTFLAGNSNFQLQDFRLQFVNGDNSLVVDGQTQWAGVGDINPSATWESKSKNYPIIPTPEYFGPSANVFSVNDGDQATSSASNVVDVYITGVGPDTFSSTFNGALVYNDEPLVVSTPYNFGGGITGTFSSNAGLVASSDICWRVTMTAISNLKAINTDSETVFDVKDDGHTYIYDVNGTLNSEINPNQGMVWLNKNQYAQIYALSNQGSFGDFSNTQTHYQVDGDNAQLVRYVLGEITSTDLDGYLWVNRGFVQSSQDIVDTDTNVDTTVVKHRYSNLSTTRTAILPDPTSPQLLPGLYQAFGVDDSCSPGKKLLIDGNGFAINGASVLALDTPRAWVILQLATDGQSWEIVAQSNVVVLSDTNVPNGVKGILAVSNGGTGADTFAGAGIFLSQCTDVVAQTVANTNILTVTAPNDGISHTYNVGGYVSPTAISVNVITPQVTFTDENNVSRTLSLFVPGLTSAGITTKGFFSLANMTIRVKDNTNIVFKTSITGVGSQTYDAGGCITQLN